MKSLHIRDVDEIVVKRLRILAQLHHRSVQGEIRAILEEATQRAPADMPVEIRPLDIETVSTGTSGAAWNRQDIYGDDAR